MSGNRLCIPGTNVSTPSQPLISVETVSIRRLKTGSSSCEWAAGHETAPRLVEPASDVINLAPNECYAILHTLEVSVVTGLHYSHVR